MARPGGLPLPTITDDRALGEAIIKRSFRFDRASSTHLERTVSSTSNRKTFTVSAWVKRSNIIEGLIFGQTDNAGNDMFYLVFDSNHKLYGLDYDYPTNNFQFVTTQVFRDPSAWYHIVLAVDTTQSTSTDRWKLYVNGSQVTAFDSATYPSQNLDTWVNHTTYPALIGMANWSGFKYDGYMAEYNFIDGQALDSSYFGFTDGQTGIWMPKRYEGTYGTNGFYLDFSDNSSITNMMIDKSPNGNDWSPDNCNTEDSMLDTPSNNFCTFIGVEPGNSNFDLAEGNLFLDVLDSHKAAFGTMGLRSGKWYWEGRLVDATGGYTTTKWTTAVTDIENTKNTQTTNTNYLLGKDSATYSHGDTVSIYYRDLYKNGTKVTDDYIPIYATNDIIQMALDVDGGKVWFGRNGTWVNGSASASTTLNESSHDITVTTGKVYTPAFGGEFSDICANFGQDGSFAGGVTAQGNKDESGQGNFYYAVPSGFKAICAANLPITTPSILDPKKHFDTLLYTGNGGSSQTISGLEFKPDLLFFKGRNHAAAGLWIDSVRGVTKNIRSNSNAQEGTTTAFLESFNLDGFTVGQSGTTNGSSETNVAWCWKAGGAAVSNTDGSITTSCSANQEAGFSIITYTGTGSQTTVGHGLGKAPKVVITKLRDTTTQDWFFMPGELTGNRATYIKFNTTDGVASDAHTYPDVAPTSTVYTIGGNDGGNGSNGNGYGYVAYCWAEIPGYSKFDTYVGKDSADGGYVHLGFRPAWLMIRKVAGEDWVVYDTKTQTRNEIGQAGRLYADLDNAQSGTTKDMDFHSNGFKLRKSTGIIQDGSNEFIYMAFAEKPDLTPYNAVPTAKS